MHERDRQNERRAVHTFPQRSQHCLPPQQGSRESGKTGAREVFINHTLPFVHPRSIFISLPSCLYCPPSSLSLAAEMRAGCMVVVEEWRAPLRCAAVLSFSCEASREIKRNGRALEWPANVSYHESFHLGCGCYTTTPVHRALSLSQWLCLF